MLTHSQDDSSHGSWAIATAIRMMTTALNHDIKLQTQEGKYYEAI